MQRRAIFFVAVALIALASLAAGCSSSSSETASNAAPASTTSTPTTTTTSNDTTSTVAAATDRTDTAATDGCSPELARSDTTPTDGTPIERADGCVDDICTAAYTKFTEGGYESYADEETHRANILAEAASQLHSAFQQGLALAVDDEAAAGKAYANQLVESELPYKDVDAEYNRTGNVAEAAAKAAGLAACQQMAGM